MIFINSLCTFTYTHTHLITNTCELGDFTDLKNILRPLTECNMSLNSLGWKLLPSGGENYVIKRDLVQSSTNVTKLNDITCLNI